MSEIEIPSTEQIVEQVVTDDINPVDGTPAEPVADKTFTQAELDEIVQKRINKLERKMDRQRIEAETRATVTKEFTQQRQAVDNEPKIEDFSDYREFQRATAKFDAKQALIDAETELKNDKQKKVYESENQRINGRELEAIERGERKYDDFEDVIRASTIKLSNAAYLAIVESDIAEDLFYYLNSAKHADEAKRIDALPEYAQAKEIGKLEDKLAAKNPATPSKAPKPIDPVDGSSAATKTIEQMTPAEYRELRKKQGARWAN